MNAVGTSYAASLSVYSNQSTISKMATRSSARLGNSTSIHAPAAVVDLSPEAQAALDGESTVSGDDRLASSYSYAALGSSSSVGAAPAIDSAVTLHQLENAGSTDRAESLIDRIATSYATFGRGY